MTSKEIKTTRNILKNQVLTDHLNVEGHQKEAKQIQDLLQRTFEFGESNSALLIGPRGSGKTHLINHVLENLSTQKSFLVNSILVKLNGLLHTDDKLALASITSQMQLENVVGDKVFGSFAENLAFLLACLRTGHKETSKSVLFIIDEFDLFCGHHNQTLLYNLFDISQSAQAPICVIGITCRFDVVELLEKRVKSRFSHRQIFIFHGTKENKYVNYVKHKVSALLELKNRKELSKQFVNRFNKAVNELISDKAFENLMQRLVDIDLNEGNLKNMLVCIIGKLSLEHETPTLADFEEEMLKFEKDSITEQILDLSILEISLLISIKHHMEIYESQPMNFEMIFSRYIKFMNSCSNIEAVQRPVIMKAYEHLLNLELLEPIAANARTQKEYEMVRPLVTNDQILEAVKRWNGLPTELSQWAISSLV